MYALSNSIVRYIQSKKTVREWKKSGERKEHSQSHTLLPIILY